MRSKWKRLYPDAYRLKDQGPAGQVSIFLLVGSEKALLIDSGYGLLDLPELVREVTDKPVILVNTHGHLDHANGSWQFETAYLRSEDMQIYLTHSSREFLGSTYAKESNNPQLTKMLESAPAKLMILDGIEEFNLGDRSVQVLHMPGHTKGSVCLIDEDRQSAFTGDNLCRSIWLSLPESVTVAEYQVVLEETLNVMQQKGIIWNYAAHNPGKTKICEDIRRFLLCCDAILSGSKKPRFLNAGPTSGWFLGKRGRYILYPKK